MVEREKWILYKHISDYERVKAVALDVKNSCASNVSDIERHRMQERMAALNMYKMRNPKAKPLDSINHRINTLEFYMFGYEDDQKRFIFSPLGNLFLTHVNDEEALEKIFMTMLYSMQFQHYANGTPSSFQLYPFRLIFKLLRDERLNYRLYSTEYAYIIAFVKQVTRESYEALVKQILDFRMFDDEKKYLLLKKDEHTYVNCIYEWQYYTQTLLEKAGIIKVHEGEKLGKLFHPQKPNSNSNPTGRWVKNGFVELSSRLLAYADKLLNMYSCYESPLRFDDDQRMQMDIVKEIYSFYPMLLLDEIGEQYDEIQARLLELPSLIEKYSNNPDNETAYLFEDVLKEGFDMFINVETRKVGGAGHTDIECLYTYYKELKKFAVEAKSTANKLTGVNAGRLREHREQIGGEYTIVITPRYVPAAKRDIYGQPIVMILASTFSEYLYNHLYHDVREIDFRDFDEIITNHLGEDVSKYISNMTMEKFATMK
jgi:type II restriction enzyme